MTIIKDIPKGFAVCDTNCHVKLVYKDGKWGEMEIVKEPYVKMHILACGMHYGQSIFEGMKAFRGQDGKVRLFRPDENAKRFIRSATRVCLPIPSEELFVNAVKKCVANNMDFVPSYESGASLYVRPFMIASDVRLDLSSPTEATFIVLCNPVGDFYGGPIPAIVMDNYDRAAPLGVGGYKVAGNYALAMLPSAEAKQQGYPATLFLDSKTHTHIEEFNSSNFGAINQQGSYVTPKSDSILPSITNNSFEALAKDAGIKVERRPVPVEELSDFVEVGAIGTAVVCTPISKVSIYIYILYFNIFCACMYVYMYI